MLRHGSHFWAPLQPLVTVWRQAFAVQIPARQHQDWMGCMSTMKVHRKYWLLAAAVLGALLAMWAYERDGAPVTTLARAIPQPHAAPARTAHAPAAPAAQQRRVLAAEPVRHSYIVQAASAGEAGNAVRRAGGTVTGDLSVIRAVSALLDENELAALREAHVPRLEVFADAPVSASSMQGAPPETYYPSDVAAQELQVGGLTGAGVTMAVVDSGLWTQEGPDHSAPGQSGRLVLALYDVLAANQNR